jgi:hypothetical protein
VIPVSSAAFFRVSSSILIVVLICIYMHKLCIYVKRFARLSLHDDRRQLAPFFSREIGQRVIR